MFTSGSGVVKIPKGTHEVSKIHNNVYPGSKG